MRCAVCGATYGLDERVWRCRCGGALDLDAPVERLSPAVVRERAPDFWRYAEVLPPLRERVSLGEPMTPLVPWRHRGRPAWLKCDYLMPTGSYKDRGAAVLMSHVKALGVAHATDDSSGNAAASLAAYAAAAGVRMTVFCPAAASPGKLAQIRLYGAAVRLVEGPRARTTEALLAELERDPGLFYASHLWHPFFTAGMKTLAFEMTEQRGWRVPDAVLCPVGAGSILLGLHGGFADLMRMGLATRLPRLFAIQAEAVAPVARAWRAGATDVTRLAAPEPTLAEGIALPAPVRGAAVLRALRESSGGVATVTEDEIRDGLRGLGRQGFCVEPTSAVVVKGLEHLEDSGELDRDEEVVLVLSGFGLKAGAALERIVETPRASARDASQTAEERP
jgi:threonine synthase